MKNNLFIIVLFALLTSCVRPYSNIIAANNTTDANILTGYRENQRINNLSETLWSYRTIGKALSENSEIMNALKQAKGFIILIPNDYSYKIAQLNSSFLKSHVSLLDINNSNNNTDMLGNKWHITSLFKTPISSKGFEPAYINGIKMTNCAWAYMSDIPINRGFICQVNGAFVK